VCCRVLQCPQWKVSIGPIHTHTVMQCVALCCSVLQCPQWEVSIDPIHTHTVVQCVALCCSVLCPQWKFSFDPIHTRTPQHPQRRVAVGLGAERDVCRRKSLPNIRNFRNFGYGVSPHDSLFFRFGSCFYVLQVHPINQ